MFFKQNQYVKYPLLASERDNLFKFFIDNLDRLKSEENNLLLCNKVEQINKFLKDLNSEIKKFGTKILCWLKKILLKKPKQNPSQHEIGYAEQKHIIHDLLKFNKYSIDNWEISKSKQK